MKKSTRKKYKSHFFCTAEPEVHQFIGVILDKKKTEALARGRHESRTPKLAG